MFLIVFKLTSLQPAIDKGNFLVNSTFGGHKTDPIPNHNPVMSPTHKPTIVPLNIYGSLINFIVHKNGKVLKNKQKSFIFSQE